MEADVSTRTIAVTSGYSGAEILVFGTIENSRQPSAESGFYDVVVVVEGAPEALMVRKKGRVAGLWVNTSTFNFNAVPSYYAVASTRPLEEFADATILDENGIGLDAVRMAAAADSAVRVSSEDLIAYKSAVTRLKQSASLFKRDDYGVVDRAACNGARWTADGPRISVSRRQTAEPVSVTRGSGARGH